jgi:hypothetical protein
LPPLSVHVVWGEKLPPALGLVLQLTVPLGVMCELPLSVTVTVHVVDVATLTVLELQLMLVVVVRVTEMACEPVLDVCRVSPAYEAVTV